MNFLLKTNDKNSMNQLDLSSISWIAPNITVWVKNPNKDKKGYRFRKAQLISFDVSRYIAKLKFLDSDNHGEAYFSLNEISKASAFWSVQGIEDMIFLKVNNNPEILNNFLVRFEQGNYYTALDDTLFYLHPKIINPGIFSKTTMSFYKKSLNIEEEFNWKNYSPHIYGLIVKCIKETTRINQNIFIQGERGSGKTVNFLKGIEFIGNLNKPIGENIDSFVDLSGFF